MAEPPLPLIAIDGPGGVGKTTVSRALAAGLGYYFFSSGLIYRAMALHLRAKGWRPGEAPDPAHLAPFSLRVGAGGAIKINDAPAPEHLHDEQTSHAASLVSELPQFRAIANAAQRETVARIAAEHSFAGVVLEGRDIGTVVFPEAPHKVFLTARPEIRAERRFLEQQRKNPGTTREHVLAGLAERDTRDTTRKIAPLKPAPGALVIDTSALTMEQVLETILSLVRQGATNETSPPTICGEKDTDSP